MFNYYFFVNIITGDIMLYFLIFISKVVELTLGTLRMIVVANGKKVLGSFLQGVISLIWVFAISNVITNLKDPLNIIFFVLGSIIGSYLGGLLEEIIALGTNMLVVITDKDIANSIREENYIVTETKGSGLNGLKYLLFIIVKRKNIMDLKKTIKKYDQNALIISDSINV